MARPRTGQQPRRTVSLSLSPEAIAVLDQLGPNRSQAAEKAILLTDRFPGPQVSHPTPEDLDRAIDGWTPTITRTPPAVPQQETPPTPVRKPPNPVTKQETIAQLRATLDATRAACTHHWKFNGYIHTCEHCGVVKPRTP